MCYSEERVNLVILPVKIKVKPAGAGPNRSNVKVVNTLGTNKLVTTLDNVEGLGRIKLPLKYQAQGSIYMLN